MTVTLTRVDRRLDDLPSLLREIADDLDMGCPRAVQLVAADSLRAYAADLESFARALAARFAFTSN